MKKLLYLLLLPLLLSPVLAVTLTVVMYPAPRRLLRAAGVTAGAYVRDEEEYEVVGWVEAAAPRLRAHPVVPADPGGGRQVRPDSAGPRSPRRFSWVSGTPRPSSDSRHVDDAPDPPLAHRLRVLVVDAHRDAADGLGRLLALLGYDTRVAYCGRSALAALDTFPPDVAVLDADLPGAGARAVAASLCRALARRPVLVGVSGSPPAGRAGVKFDHCFGRPFDPRTLLRLLEGYAAACRPRASPPPRPAEPAGADEPHDSPAPNAVPG